MRFAFALVALTAGCSSQGSPVNTAEGGSAGNADPCLICNDGGAIDASLAVQVGGMLRICAGDDCHRGAAGNLSIAGPNDFSSLIRVHSSEEPNLYRVNPGDPGASYMYLKMACDGGIKSACMPLGHPDPRLAQLVHDWIEAGASVP